MVGSASRDLTRAEQSYVAQVQYQVRHLPDARKRALLQDLRRTLLAGTPVDTYARLERDRGKPSDYAALAQGLGRHDDAAAHPPASKRRGFWRR